MAVCLKWYMCPYHEPLVTHGFLFEPTNKNPISTVRINHTLPENTWDIFLPEK